jgi:leader peptidase (prepilin peptidase)/N-methyltransferase
LVFWQIGFTAFLPVSLVFVTAIVALIFIDAEHMILPNVITYPLFVFALLIRVSFPLFFGSSFFSDTAFYPLNSLDGYPAWMVSLSGAFLGALLGWRLTLLTIFLGALTGAVAGMIVIARQKDKDLQTQIPFGIFLGIGSILALLFGEQMIAWYIETFIPR